MESWEAPGDSVTPAMIARRPIGVKGAPRTHEEKTPPEHCQDGVEVAVVGQDGACSPLAMRRASASVGQVTQ